MAKKSGVSGNRNHGISLGNQTRPETSFRPVPVEGCYYTVAVTMLQLYYGWCVRRLTRGSGRGATRVQTAPSLLSWVRDLQDTSLLYMHDNVNTAHPTPNSPAT